MDDDVEDDEDDGDDDDDDEGGGGGHSGDNGDNGMFSSSSLNAPSWRGVRCWCSVVVAVGDAAVGDVGVGNVIACRGSGCGE